MNTAEILALFDREQRRDIDYPDMRKEALPLVTRFVRAAPGKSMIVHSRVDDASPMSRPIVAKHGFQLLTDATECNWKPAA